MTFVDTVIASALGQLVALAVVLVSVAIAKLVQAVGELNAIRRERGRCKK